MLLKSYLNTNNDQIKIFSDIHEITISFEIRFGHIEIIVFNFKDLKTGFCCIEEFNLLQDDFISKFENKYIISCNDLEEKYSKFIYNEIKKNIREDANSFLEDLKNTQTCSPRKCLKLVKSSIYWLEDEIINKIINTNLVNGYFETNINYNYMVEKNNFNKEWLLTLLSRNKNTKYIPMVLLLEELKNNNWFNNCDESELLAILMKENYNSYHKLELLKNISKDFKHCEEKFDIKELNTFKCILCFNSDESRIQYLLENIKTKKELLDFLNVFDNKEIINITIYDVNPKILKNMENLDEETKKSLVYLEDNYFFCSNLFKLSFLENMKNVNTDIIYEIIREIEYNLESYLRNKENLEYWNEIMNVPFFQEILLRKNIKSF